MEEKIYLTVQRTWVLKLFGLPVNPTIICIRRCDKAFSMFWFCYNVMDIIIIIGWGSKYLAKQCPILLHSHVEDMPPFRFIYLCDLNHHNETA